MEGSPSSGVIAPPFPSKQSSKNTNDPRQKKRLPSPKELIAHYESQGLETQEAAVKVIDDLQNVLFRVITSERANNNKNKSSVGGETSRKLDVIAAHMMNLEKVDSKPGYAQTLAIGVASGAVLQGIGSVTPNVFGAVAQIWDPVRGTTSGRPA